MPIRDLLLPLFTYPEPTRDKSIEAILDMAEAMSERHRPSGNNDTAVRTRVSAVIFQVQIEPGLYYEGAQFGEFMAAELRKSADSAHHLSKNFEALAKKRRCLNSSKLIEQNIHDSFDTLVSEARLCQMTVLPVSRGNEFHRALAERTIFESGRPVLLFPESRIPPVQRSFSKIAVAWDGSRGASRAVGDAMPFLRRADEVRIFSATNDKKMEGSARGIEIADKLKAEGVSATYDEVLKDNGSTIGTFMENYVAEHESNLLVMGAYGHSRLREFLLGGATMSVLINPPTWVMMSY
ncbi:MAG: universal stress protein [Rhizobiales bacterium]|nr:universal stress protein [Hyphomicrobiales bacterium]